MTNVAYNAEVVVVVGTPGIASRNDVMNVESCWVIVPTNFATTF